MTALLSRLFRCRHRRTTRPMQLPGERKVTVSCLRCARRLIYDWQNMRIVKDLRV